MKIIIVGAGKIGTTIAKYLVNEKNDVTIIDTNATLVTNITESMDVMGIIGNGATVEALKGAEVNKCDVIISTTSTDEINLLVAFIAKKLGAKHTITRVRNPEYNETIDLFRDEMGINVVVNPELETAREIARLLRFPHASQIETFMEGKVELVGVRIKADCKLANKRIFDIFHHEKNNVLLAIIERGEEVIIPNGNDVIQEDDIAYFIGKASDVLRFFKQKEMTTSKVKNVMIIGGSRIGYYLASTLAKSHTDVKLVEMDEKHCVYLNDLLPKALIINGDASNEEILLSENIDQMDGFVSLTGRDEDNLLLALFAVKQNVGKIIAKVNKINFSIVKEFGLDSIVMPKNLVASQIVRYVRALNNTVGNNLITLYHLVDGQIEVAEFKVSNTAKCVNVPLKQLHNKIKGGVLIATIVRNNKVIIPTGDTSIMVGDNIIIATKLKNIEDLNDIMKEG